MFYIFIFTSLALSDFFPNFPKSETIQKQRTRKPAVLLPPIFSIKLNFTLLQQHFLLLLILLLRYFRLPRSLLRHFQNEICHQPNLPKSNIRPITAPNCDSTDSLANHFKYSSPSLSSKCNSQSTPHFLQIDG